MFSVFVLEGYKVQGRVCTGQTGSRTHVFHGGVDEEVVTVLHIVTLESVWFRSRKLFHLDRLIQELQQKNTDPDRSNIE